MRKNELMDASTSALLEDLRAIGNAAAHNQTNPTEQEALRFLENWPKSSLGSLEVGTGAALMPPPGSYPARRLREKPSLSVGVDLLRRRLSTGLP